MSYRIELFKNNRGLAFGNDHACGWFLQIWDTSKYREPDAENIIVDEDSLLTGLDRPKMLSLLAAHGFTESELGEAYAKAKGGAE